MQKDLIFMNAQPLKTITYSISSERVGNDILFLLMLYISKTLSYRPTGDILYP